MMFHRISRLAGNLIRVAISRRRTGRALAACFKLYGVRLQRRWPFVVSAAGKDLNLGFDDLLEFQRARSLSLKALVVGAYDGVANDPASEFLCKYAERVVFVEPQPLPFAKLQKNMASQANVLTVNAAIDNCTGFRDLFSISRAGADLPEWTEQLASFNREHLVKHEQAVPGLSSHIVVSSVPTLSFADLLRQHNILELDVLQIDAEGMDAQLLGWFPFSTMRPGLLHYETAHMSEAEHGAISEKLRLLGYKVYVSDSPTDDMAVLI